MVCIVAIWTLALVGMALALPLEFISPIDPAEQIAKDSQRADNGAR